MSGKSPSIRDAVYLIAELQALGHSQSELLVVARSLDVEKFEPECILSLADRDSVMVFDCAS